MVFISRPGACPLFNGTSSRTLVCSVALAILCLAGCVQDSPLSSSEHTVSVLLESLRDESPDVRRTAAESLGKIGDPRAVDSILPLMHDPAAMVREASILAMGRLKPPATEGVVVLLTQALEDPVESVRQAAVVAIGEIEPGLSITATSRRITAISGCNSEEGGSAGLVTSRLKSIDSCARRSRT